MRSESAKGPARLGTISALGIIQIFAWGSSYYLPAILSKPIAADTGWGLPLVSAGLSLALLASALLAPRVGRLIRDRGGRDPVIGGLALLAAGLVLLGSASTIPVYALAWIAIGAGMSGTLYDAAFSTLGRYYGYDARSAITTLTLFGGFASTICWPLSAALLDHAGWRAVCFAFAALHLILCIPLALRFLPPVDSPAAATGEAASAPRKTRLSEPERRAFLLLAVIITTGGTLATVVSVHLIQILQARDVSLAAAVSFGALIGPSQVAARVVDMVIGRRLPAVMTLVTASALIAAGIVALASGYHVVALALVLYGAGNGIWSIARGAVPLALFGPERFPVLMGGLATPNLVAQSLAPPLSAAIMQGSGAERIIQLLAAAALANVALALLLAFLAMRPRGAVAA